MMSNEDGRSDGELPQVVRWHCHIHINEKCLMAIIKGVQYHVITVTEIDRYAQTEFNERRTLDTNNSSSSGEFWEKSVYVCAVADCDLIQNFTFVQTIFKLFSWLDSKSIIYTRQTSAKEMI
uniref:GrBNV_gp93-like protein n=1 Tax=Nilaparvata lugens endogenous nudivirus TaxID=1487700 RepID=X5GE56_9VIRU|nr:GrBNV_gp93-like protein [Nilaparvata lugens endogenous nudivirus]